LRQADKAEVDRLLSGRLVLSNGGPGALVCAPTFCSLTSTVAVRQFDVVVPLGADDRVCGVAGDLRRLAAPEADLEGSFMVLSAKHHVLRFTHAVTALACVPYTVAIVRAARGS
jgi:hypothetical protein